VKLTSKKNVAESWGKGGKKKKETAPPRRNGKGEHGGDERKKRKGKRYEGMTIPAPIAPNRERKQRWKKKKKISIVRRSRGESADIAEATMWKKITPGSRQDAVSPSTEA